MSEKLKPTEYHIGQQEDTLKLFELRNAATCCGFLLPSLHELPPTFKFIDVGCGPASITFDLARRFPQAQIIGVDQSQEVIERNSANIQKSAPGTGIEFRVGNILQPESFVSPDEMGTFDIVFEHATLIHIAETSAALKQMRRVSKAKGGIVASRNGDIRSQILYPPCAENSQFIEELYALNGQDTATGRKITGHALKAGWRRDQITPSASVLWNISADERKTYASSMLSNLADPESEMRKSAKALQYSDDRLQVLRDNLERFIKADDGWRLLICCEILCRNDS